MKWLIEGKSTVTIGFGLALFVIAAIGIVAYRNARQFIETNQLVTHTLEVLTELDATLSDLVDAETGERGFIITHDDRFLEPYISARADYQSHIQRLRALTVDNHHQQSRLDRLVPLVEEKLTLAENNIALVRNEGTEAARAAVMIGQGKALMDQIRAIIAEMGQEERSLLEDRRVDAQATANLTLITFSALTILTLALLVVVYWLINRAQTTLRLSRERWRSLVENTPDTVTTFDLDGTLTYINRVTAEISIEAIIGKNTSDFVPTEQREILTQAIQRVRKTGKPTTYEISTMPGNRYLVNNLAPILIDGEVVSFIASSADITEFKQAQKQIEQLNNNLKRRSTELEVLNKELEAFSYSVSHDLRAPLRSIDGFSQVLLEDFETQLGSEGAAHLQRIRAATQRMGNLIDDLINLARISRSEMRRDTIDLSQMARKITHELQERQPERQVDFIIADGVMVEGDANLLRVMLENLMDNAWKFTSKRPDAHIIFDRCEQPNGELAFFVRDDGDGFNMAYSSKLFGAFQRLHAASDFEGTGIGLATVKRIVHRHGGRV